MNIVIEEKFVPDSQHILDVLNNRKPTRLPMYEHRIDTGIMSKCIGQKVEAASESVSDLEEYYRTIQKFYTDHGYDTFEFEIDVTGNMPGFGAIFGGTGPIQNREDFEKYPWLEIPFVVKNKFMPHLEALERVLAAGGARTLGSVGWGVFETVQDLVGYESLCLMQADDEMLYGDLFVKVGDLLAELWSWALERYEHLFAFCRMGDDLGYKTSTMLAPDIIRQHILPQHRRIIKLCHKHGKKVLMHSCGCIFPVFDDIIANGIDAKHSNEDAVAPFETWIERYGDKIGLLGGIDLNLLVSGKPDDVFAKVLEDGTRFRAMAKGYGIGTGHSIPRYVPVDNFEAMLTAVREVRRRG